MPRYAPNKMPAAVKRRYFELIRMGLPGCQAAERVGVSLSCGSLWFIDAGCVSFVEVPISSRYLSQDDRIEIAEDSPAVSRSRRSPSGSAGATRPSTGRSPGIVSPTAATSRGMRTTGHTSAAAGPGRGGSSATLSCGNSWPPSWPSAGRRPRSAAGCGAATGTGPAGRCAPRPSMRASIAVSSSQRGHRTCAPAAGTATAGAGAALATVR